MQTITRFRTGVGQTTVLVPDWHLTPFTIGVQVIVTGTVAFNLEYTMDSEDSVQTSWFIYTGWTGVSASQAGIFEIPCRGLRLNVTSGTGTVTGTFVQAGRR